MVLPPQLTVHQHDTPTTSKHAITWRCFKIEDLCISIYVGNVLSALIYVSPLYCNVLRMTYGVNSNRKNARVRNLNLATWYGQTLKANVVPCDHPSEPFVALFSWCSPYQLIWHAVSTLNYSDILTVTVVNETWRGMCISPVAHISP